MWAGAHGQERQIRVSQGITLALTRLAAVWLMEVPSRLSQIMLARGDHDIEHRDQHGNTALLWAAKQGNVLGLRALINHGADVHVREGRASSL